MESSRRLAGGTRPMQGDRRSSAARRPAHALIEINGELRRGAMMGAMIHEETSIRAVITRYQISSHCKRAIITPDRSRRASRHVGVRGAKPHVAVTRDAYFTNHSIMRSLNETSAQRVD